jgi:hypothetical protein
MPDRVRPLPVASLLIAIAIAIAASAAARAAGDVTIYRCVATDGKVSLQDRPCPKDAHQDVREMARPQDAPPRPPAAETRTSPAPPPTEVRIVHVRDPQPLYECTSYDGQTYLSQSGVPQSHFVPLWVQGLDPRTMNDGFVNVGGRAPVPPPAQTGGPIVYSPGTWVEDRCIRLPQAEVCQRIRDRQDELGTRIFNAQPSDRARFERERQGLAEQLQSDCSGN